MTIDKTYQPAAVEGRIYAAWEASGAFRAGRPERSKAEPYCIVIPPPNVTGSLHMGHALNNTLQDILCRFERMRGKDVLWQPGTDHAGIATQAVVERQLMERQEPPSRVMGREAFIKRVWEWKAESGGAIIGQLKRLGASCDWSRERFTMDEGLSRAVAKVFVALYREGLIYKDKRLVNWDPKLKTAISDLEVQQVETKGNLWHIKYPIEGSDEFIVVATTRPETMLGDVAVAVHPQNERLKHLIGKTAILPLVGRRIPIIGDDYADPEKGTGAVKITPAHDFNDFEVGRRHNLPLVNILDAEGQLDLKDNAAFLHGIHRSPPLAETLALDGLDRFAARKKIVERLEALGLIDKIEPTIHTVPHGDRSAAVIEPYLTDQWYVDAKTLAQPAIEAVRLGKTVFVPSQWEATFFNWLENIQPWCISRQIWWGHQIPAWYGPDGKLFVAENEDDAVADALAHYTDTEEITVEQGHDIAADPTRRAHFANEYLKRDEDVLDTWFSSALWPFSTLGWPDETPELKRFYPTSVLVTGFDIIFFWVARMMMMGLHFMKEVPFPTVYIHALVRDASGAKMSKSKGNVIDPLELTDEYGADALRFTLTAMAAQGRDIKLSSERVAGYRNFVTKLWNAARFGEVNGCVRNPDFDPRHAKETLNRWIAHETAKTEKEVSAAVEAYKFNEAAGAIYRFVWNIYCDWYLELIKPVLTGPDSDAKSETQAAAAWALDEILKLLHPFMPFVTEELWRVTAERGEPRPHMLVLEAWPSHDGLENAAAEGEIGWIVDLVTAIRSVRVEMNIPPATLLPLVFAGVAPPTADRARRWADFVRRLARVSDIAFADAAPEGSLQLVVRGEVAALPLKGVIDLAAERARLAKEMSKCDADIARVDQKLGNADFLKRAPEEVVEGEREKRAEAEQRKAKIAEALARLENAAEDVRKPTKDVPERTISIFVLGAGFSHPAGLPLADELWREIRRRAGAMTGRAEKFRDDLNDYIEYVASCDGVTLSPDDVNFEKFLSYLDVEFHLGLLGKDTWSSEGNETQVVVKTLIGQILAERTPQVIPQLYEDFAKKLKPGDTVLTFNYDVLLERSLDKIGMPYRLFSDRFTEVDRFGGTTDLDRELGEVLILKLHGSLDWFSKESYLRMEEEFRRIGAPGHPHNAIFNPSSGFHLKQLVEGPRPPGDLLQEVYRVLDVERLYKDPPLFLQVPLIVPPSTSKILWFDRFKDFWWGMGSYGVLNRRLTVIGFSLAAADEYARQIIYTITRNYQKYHWGTEELGLGKKTPMLIIDYQTDAKKQQEFRQRYAFVDWSRAEVYFEGFDAAALNRIL